MSRLLLNKRNTTVALFIIFVWGLLLAGDFSPDNNEELNHKHIFFRWPQILGTSDYELIIYDSSGLSAPDTILVSTNSHLLKDNLNWNSTYQWEVCRNNSGVYDCLEEHIFSINPLPEYHTHSINIISEDPGSYQQGINIMDFESLGYSLAVDMNGEIVWFADKYQFNSSQIIITQFLDNGNFIGFANGVGYEFNLSSDIIFETPSDMNVHHQISKTENDTYLLIDAEIEYHSCPDECPDEYSFFPVPWQGDRFIEINTEGEILWIWDAFQGISLNEYNPYYAETYNGTIEFDWTHSNSVEYIPQSNSVIASIRNLSRIISIDYDTGEVNWGVGESDYMEQPDFQNEINFSQQHSAQMTADGNLIFFDNGRFQDPELSRCLEVAFDSQNEPYVAWEYTLPDSMFTGSRGECDRLENQNSLISAGRTGNVVEVNNENEIAWHLKVYSESGADVSIYRTDRVQDLYPDKFSFEIDGMTGAYPDFLLSDTGYINCRINNRGWKLDSVMYQLQSYSDSVLLNGVIAVDSTVSTHQINISDIELESSEYKLKFISHTDTDDYQEVNFSFTSSMLGDLNNDFEVNILDILILVDIIMSNSSWIFSADVNGDENLDILDVVIIIAITIRS